MNILAIGDVVGNGGCEFLRRHLSSLKKLKGIDLVIANGENSAENNGITAESARYLFDSGVDVVTSGNHAFRRREAVGVFDSMPCLLRPVNYPKGAPGVGVCTVDLGYVQVCVVNLMGVAYMEPLDNPFYAVDKVLNEIGTGKVVVVDFHAEATAEKKAMGFYLDGRVSALFGTHTHVATADECVLPGGTGYITDIGMTGAVNSVLGIEPGIAIDKLKTRMPVFHRVAGGPFMMCGAIFSIDEKTGKCLRVERIEVR